MPDQDFSQFEFFNIFNSFINMWHVALNDSLNAVMQGEQDKKNWYRNWCVDLNSQMNTNLQFMMTQAMAFSRPVAEALVELLDCYHDFMQRAQAFYVVSKGDVVSNTYHAYLDCWFSCLEKAHQELLQNTDYQKTLGTLSNAYLDLCYKQMRGGHEGAS